VNILKGNGGRVQRLQNFKRCHCGGDRTGKSDAIEIGFEIDRYCHSPSLQLLKLVTLWSRQKALSPPARGRKAAFRVLTAWSQAGVRRTRITTSTCDTSIPAGACG